jgi:hypothetical protein
MTFIDCHTYLKSILFCNYTIFNLLVDAVLISKLPFGGACFFIHAWQLLEVLLQNSPEALSDSSRLLLG